MTSVKTGTCKNKKYLHYDVLTIKRNKKFVTEFMKNIKI